MQGGGEISVEAGLARGPHTVSEPAQDTALVSIGDSVTDTHANTSTHARNAGTTRTIAPRVSEPGVGSRNRAPTPINGEMLAPFLKRYPKTLDAQFLRNGFQQGFRIGYKGQRVTVMSKNLKSAYELKDVLLNKLKGEIALGRIVGPFDAPPFPNFRCSPVGLVPKRNPGEYRMIHHLSAPRVNSVNSQIDPTDCSVVYTTFDEAVALVQGVGKGACMGKTDVKSAFRLLPVHPDDFDLLGMCIEGKFYYDRCMPMGCSIACSTFEKFSVFLEYCCQDVAGSRNVLHYLDDFFFAGRSSRECRHLMCSFQALCERFGVPIAQEKTEGPVTSITFLGLEIDSVVGQVRVPEDKVSSLLEKINIILGKEKVTRRTLQSVVGSLNFVCRAVSPGRAFLRRLIELSSSVREQHHKIRLSSGAKEDLKAWQQFLSDFNGRIFFLGQHTWNNEELQFYTDASGGIGFGAYFNGKWTQGRWPDGVRTPTYPIALLEFFPIVVGVQLWAPHLENKRVSFWSDNQAVVTIINSQTSKCPIIMQLLRELVVICLCHNIRFRARYVPGIHNNIADALSRYQSERFRRIAPHADQHPTPPPVHLWTIFNRSGQT